MGQGPYLIVEADEYDRSFLSMYPTVVLITNIDGDHLDCYGTMENIKEAFVEFARKVPFYGFVVANLDDPEVCSECVVWVSVGDMLEYLKSRKEFLWEHIT